MRDGKRQKGLRKKKKKKKASFKIIFRVVTPAPPGFSFFESWHRLGISKFDSFPRPPLNFPINSRFYCIFIDQFLAKSFENWPIFLEKLPEVSCFFKIFKASRALWQKVSKIGLFSLKNRRKSADFSSSLLKNLNFSSFHGILTKSFWNWPIFQEKIHRKRN